MYRSQFNRTIGKKKLKADMLICPDNYRDANLLIMGNSLY